jgi:rhodanese-related sulfurtransferase
VDVRSAGEYASGHAPGTLNIPLQELSSRLAEIPKSSPVVVGCASGSRSGMAKLLLKKNGYPDVSQHRHLAQVSALRGLCRPGRTFGFRPRRRLGSG